MTLKQARESCGTSDRKRQPLLEGLGALALYGALPTSRCAINDRVGAAIAMNGSVAKPRVSCAMEGMPTRGKPSPAYGYGFDRYA